MCGWQMSIQYSLAMTLEEIFAGRLSKKLRVTRQRPNLSFKLVDEVMDLELDVKPGHKAGTKWTFAGEGNQSDMEAPAGDVVIVLEEKKHDRFTREGNDLVYTKSVSVKQSLLGLEFDIESITGETLHVDCLHDRVGEPGYEKILPRKGMPNPKNPFEFGHLRIRFVVNWPREISLLNKVLLDKLTIQIFF